MMSEVDTTVEEKLARLGLDEAPQLGSAASSSATQDTPLAPGLPEGEPSCRICLEDGEPSRPIVQPCGCRGTSTWAHADCLTAWRRTAQTPKAAYHCGQCGDDYRDELSLELLEERLEEQRAGEAARAAAAREAARAVARVAAARAAAAGWEVG